MKGRDAKAELVRAGIHMYVASGEARMHLSRFSKLLNSNDELPEKLANRIQEIIASHSEEAAVG